jgi:flagellar hook-associated protein 1 FlgK
MSSTFFGLNIAKSGLYAYQSALNTAAHNITNAETEGYSRQVQTQQADLALRVNSTYGMAGTGVVVTGIKQMRDSYYDVKYRNTSTLLGEYSYKTKYMEQVQSYFNEVNVKGFTTAYDSMYSSLQELSKNPPSPTVRTQVITEAESLTEYFKTVSTNLNSVQEECNFDIKNLVDKTNSTAQQVAALTKQINTLEMNGGTANDLRDQRELLIDKLSEIANVSVEEKAVGDGVGGTNYRVWINNQPLVENYDYNTLKVVPRQEKVNMNDIDGLYEITWANGQNFDNGTLSMGGALQALFELRDGNARGNLDGTVSAVADAGKTVTLTKTNVNSAEKLNIPEQGTITIDNRDYKYNGFKVTVDSSTGKYTYQFDLDRAVVGDPTGKHANIGESIEYKGIPYYQAQMNELARTFAKNFNDIHRTGQDLNKKPGADFFTAANKVTGREYEMGSPGSSSDHDATTFNSGTGAYYTPVPANAPQIGSYYFMTAQNFKVNRELLADPSKLAAATSVVDGQENNDVVKKLIALKSDVSMFAQGTPNEFIESLVDDIGIDTDTVSNFSKSQTGVLYAVENQRLSISGVDVDEEAMNMIRFQSAYNLSAKVISVMNEIYDKLINYMGV